jgi:hypothetical protein
LPEVLEMKYARASEGGGAGMGMAAEELDEWMVAPPGESATCLPRVSICLTISRKRMEYFRSMRKAISGLDLIMSPKVSPEITMRSPPSAISAVAVRGMRSSTAISPKKSPFSRTARVTSLLAPVRFLIATRPDWMMYISSPASPSRKRTLPAGKWDRKRANGFFSAIS